MAGVGDVAWTSTLVHFTPQFEQTARMSDSEVGGAMNVHFLESQETRWFAWPSTPELQSKFDQFEGLPFTFASDVKLAKGVGVDPIEVDVVPDARRDEDARQAALVADHDYAPDDHDSHFGVAPVVVDGRLAAGFAQEGLLGIQEPGRGTVAVIWTVQGLLLCIQFAMNLRPGAHLAQALADAARLFVRSRWRRVRIAFGKRWVAFAFVGSDEVSSAAA